MIKSGCGVETTNLTKELFSLSDTSENFRNKSATT